MGNNKVNNDDNKKKKIIAIVITIIVIIILLLLGLFACNRWLVDPNSRPGYYPGKSDAEIQAELNKQVDDGMMSVSISRTIEFPNGSENPGVANIENIAANHLDQKVSIMLKDTNEVVYKTDGALLPGSYIHEITLNKHLEPGEYSAVVIFDGYTQDKHEKEGTLAGEVKLVVH